MGAQSKMKRNPVQSRCQALGGSRLRSLLKNLPTWMLLVPLVGTQVAAQMTINWDTACGGNDDEYLFAIAPAADGGYLLGGSSISGQTGNKTEGNLGDFDYWVVKLNADGVRQWDRALGGTGYDEIYSMQSTTDGGYFLGGVSDSGISDQKSAANLGAEDYWLVKLDGDGNLQWDHTFGGSSTDVLFVIRTTSDGGCVLLGQSDSGSTGNKTSANLGENDYWLVKVDQNGDKQWERAFGGDGDDYPFDLAMSQDGGYLLGGTSASGISGNKGLAGFGDYDFWVVKLDQEGNKQWESVFGGDGWDELNVVRQTRDGGYILAGSSESGVSGNKTTPNSGFWDWWLIKISSDGSKEWERVFGGAEDDEFLTGAQETSDGGYLLLGTAWSGVSGNKTTSNLGKSDFWLVKVDSDGNKQWEQVLGGDDEEYPWAMEPTRDGGYIIGGHSQSGLSDTKTSAGLGLLDFWAVALAPDTASSPRLTIERAGNQFLISWPSVAAGFVPESAFDLRDADWTAVSATPEDDGTSNHITLPFGSSNTFFRLKRP